MKRIDKAKIEFDFLTNEEIIYDNCPFNLKVCDIDYSGEYGYYQEGKQEPIDIKGCRGITCVECWNTEI